jgi:hypothetical protein
LNSFPGGQASSLALRVASTDGLNNYSVGEKSICFHPVNQITSTNSGNNNVTGCYCLFDAEYFLNGDSDGEL